MAPPTANPSSSFGSVAHDAACRYASLWPSASIAPLHELVLDRLLSDDCRTVTYLQPRCLDPPSRDLAVVVVAWCCDTGDGLWWWDWHDGAAAVATAPFPSPPVGRFRDATPASTTAPTLDWTHCELYICPLCIWLQCGVLICEPWFILLWYLAWFTCTTRLKMVWTNPLSIVGI
jgi:hypothetical protein